MKVVVLAVLALLLALVAAQSETTIWNQCLTISGGTYCGSLVEEAGNPCNLHAKVSTVIAGFNVQIFDQPIDLTVNPQACQEVNLGGNCDICASVQNITRTTDNVHGCVVVSISCLGLIEDMGCFDNGDLAQCFAAGCPNDCSGNGQCQSDGTCQCSLGYSGPDCSQNQLAWDQCVEVATAQQACVSLEFENCSIAAKMTYMGFPIYQTTIPAPQFDTYFGTAQCVVAGVGCQGCLYWTDLQLNSTYMHGCPGFNFTCLGTDYGSYELDCFEDTNIVPDCFGSCPHDCSAHGTCTNGQCICNSDYQGASCALPNCAQTNQCSGNGVCAAPNVCQCSDGWSDPKCSTPTCAQVNQCSGNGACVGPNSCACKDGYTGSSCEVKKCPNQCFNGGKCTNGACSCVSGWEGVDCTTKSNLGGGSSKTGIIVGVIASIAVVSGAVGLYVWRRQHSRRSAYGSGLLAVSTTDTEELEEAQ